MLEPREADIPFLFLVLVVLPLVAYILLGKWSDTSRKRERISLLAQLAAEEALRAEAMAVPCDVPMIATSKNGIQFCARCFSPATTRCSKCKSVRYCSGKCQIIHWRQVHKQECQQLETTSSCFSPQNTLNEDYNYGRVTINENLNSFCGYNKDRAMVDNATLDKTVDPSISTQIFATANCSAVDTLPETMLQRRSTDNHVSSRPSRGMLRKQGVAVFDSSEETSGSKPTNLSNHNNIPTVHIHGQDAASTTIENCKSLRQHGNASGLRSNYESSSLLNLGRNGTTAHETESDFVSGRGNLRTEENNLKDEMIELKTSCEAAKGTVKTKKMHSMGTKASKSKSKVKENGEHLHSEIEGKTQIADDSKISRMRDAVPPVGTNGVASISIMKMMGFRKSTKLTGHGIPEFRSMHSKIRMLFPYEEFLKIFNCEVANLLPRGLLNCGNSCYANAVLQCLTRTKPLTIFLLQRSHSRKCCRKDWCLMCELEQHVMMLRECGGPLSPSRILLHMRNNNCQIGDGSQEDAHEFLRLLIASMQTICLEELGGEDKVEPRLQETTFIQHTFAGSLRSKIKCLRCHHESERYENIMDLTLEIFGWVESLEDALTQFTTPEELDGENMYRCGSCGTYVRARKQLSIHQAPNILTIVLKRFQEGKYGKINKCITFPDMLDMIPFMTRTGDIPPLYLLYAVVVHLDTLNASFSGHYVAYVKDLQGSWFRIDDTEVQPVPMSQVMSEGAYMLFYMRSCPRPQKDVPSCARTCTARTQKRSKQGQGNSSSYIVGPEPLVDLRPENCGGSTSHAHANRSVAQVMEFSDAASSDWSLFTSSDEASFTTESTRDSFSTVDYADMCNVDAFSSIFSNLYAPESSSLNTLCCRKFSNSRAQTRFVAQGSGGYVSYMLNQPPYQALKGDNFEKVSDFSTDRTSSHCKL